VTIAIVDYGAGNLTSVVKALAVVGAAPRVVTRAQDVAGAEAIVIPGVGHFRATARLDPIRQAVAAGIEAGVPLLGICLGMQWLFEGSEEAPELHGLGLVAGRCTRIPGGTGVKVPHVGWNSVDRTGAESRLLAGIPAGSPAYFTHAYAGPAGLSTVGQTTHGEPFASVIETGRVFGAQFHPEKSGAMGLRLLTNFVQIAREAAVRC
jgi:glutamine amidotransferase